MAAIISFLKLRQNRRHTTGAEFDKKPFGENRFLTSLFLNEIIQINENSRWPSCFFNHYEFHLGPTRDQDDYMCEVS